MTTTVEVKNKSQDRLVRVVQVFRGPYGNDGAIEERDVEQFAQATLLPGESTVAHVWSGVSIRIDEEQPEQQKPQPVAAKPEQPIQAPAVTPPEQPEQANPSNYVAPTSEATTR